MSNGLIASDAMDLRPTSGRSMGFSSDYLVISLICDIAFQRPCFDSYVIAGEAGSARQDRIVTFPGAA
jgi:hypothetical protein